MGESGRNPQRITAFTVQQKQSTTPRSRKSLGLVEDPVILEESIQSVLSFAGLIDYRKMSFRPDLKNIVQDMPPPGGFPKVRECIRRVSLSSATSAVSSNCLRADLILLIVLLQVDWNATGRPRGPSGLVIWAASTGLILFGFMRVGATNKEKSAEKLLERQARYAMAPILQEETDRQYLVKQQAILKKEAEIMKDTKGWTSSVYLSNRWVPENTKPLDKNIGK
jgi:hypothetical protein